LIAFLGTIAFARYVIQMADLKSEEEHA